MPYKDKEKELAYRRAWDHKNYIKLYAKVQDRKRKLRDWMKELKATLKCKLCDENAACCLDFHHRNRENKIKHVSVMLANGHSKASILAEIDKCDVLCANCHRKLHHSESIGIT